MIDGLDERLFLTIPDGAPEWLTAQMPASGSSGKVNVVVGSTAWIDWGGGHEGWVPLAWLGPLTPATPAADPEDALAYLDMPGIRYREALAEARAAREALVQPVRRALAVGASRAAVARRSGLPRPDLYKPPWSQWKR